MYILGISGGFRQGNMDSAACLIKNNTIVAAAEEERFSRTKHAPGTIPLYAIRYCLKEAKISIKEVDTLAFTGSTYKNIKDKLRRYFNFKFGYCPSIELVEHHVSHACSTFYLSGFKESNILTMDLSGDGVSTLIAFGRGKNIKVLKKFKRPNSLGAFYNIITQYLGFNRNNDEYKIMGLASYGKPCLDLSWLLKKDFEGYIFNTDAMTKVPQGEPFPSCQEPLYSKQFLRKFSLPRLPGTKINKYHENFAASAQDKLEEIICHLATLLYKKTGSRNICIAGGVGLNCVANAKLRKLSFIDNIFIQPASSDAGLAMGSALKVAVKKGFKFSRLNHAYYGPKYSNREIENLLKKAGCSYKKHSNIPLFVAEKLSQGYIVGWFQGRMEYGPRALGARSILADPRQQEMKDKINHLVKFRESFRPFAPSVLFEYGAEYFENFVESPFMTLNFDVKKDKHQKIPAVVHVDGTSRVQSVRRNTNPRYYDMIKYFYNKTSIPAVMNTSFNIREEPIVCTPYQAVSSFYGSGIDYLAIGDFVLEKKKK